jgi:hypothetical protein
MISAPKSRARFTAEPNVHLEPYHDAMCDWRRVRVHEVGVIFLVPRV